MLDKLKNINPFKEKRFAVIGIVSGDVPIYDILILENKSDKLSINDSFSVKSFDEIKDRVDISIPILLNFSGKGIISKKVSAKNNYLKEVLFNASPDDFYIYELHQDGYEFVSIARKEVLDHHFNQFDKEKYLLIDYSIGPFVGVLLKRILNKESFLSGNYRLIFQNEDLNDFNKEVASESYSIDTDKITNSQIPLFSTLLNHLYPAEDITYDFDFLKLNKQEVVLKKVFDNAVIFLGIFFLMALLVSYVLLNYYNDQYVTYESQLYNLNHTYNQVKKLEEEKQNKVLILQESGVLKKNFISYYIHEIVNSVPGEISLSSLKINPSIKKIKHLEKIILESNTVLIEGNSKSSLPLNSWVKDLKIKKWISKIEILDYSNKRKENGKFVLKIIIK